MSTKEFHLLALSFQYRGNRPEAAQQVYAALSTLGLVGYCSAADAQQHLTFVSADLSMDEYEVPLLANAAGELSFSAQSRSELAASLLQASGAAALYLDGELVAGEDLGMDDELNFDHELSLANIPQVIAGAKIPRSELALSTLGHGGGWKLHEDPEYVLAVRTGEPVDIMLSRKMVPALELSHYRDLYHLRLHARTGTLNVEGSVALEYIFSTGQRAVPAVAAHSPAAKLQQELGLWLNGVDAEELKQLELLWPQAAEALPALFADRTERALREFIKAVGLPEKMLDLVNGEPTPADYEQLRGGLISGMNLAVEEEISSAKGIWKLLYRTGWSPAALIASSIGVLGAGALAHRWMKRTGKPGTGWRRTIMFFWYSDAGFYLARGVRDALRPKP